MKKQLLFLLAVLVSTLTFAQTTYTWIGATGGSWAVSTNWSPTRTTPAATDIIQFNDGATYTVTAVPTQTIRQLLVSNNSNISLQSSGAATLTITAAASSNALTVTSGSTLQLSSTTTNAITLAFGVATTPNTSIAGSIIINANTALTNTLNFTNLTAANNTITGTITNNGGVVTSTAATTTFGSGGTYVHAMNGGAVPTATWNAASNCNITGVTTTNPTGLSGTFGNFTWNNAGQTSATGAISAAMTVNGNLNIAAGTLLLPTFGITGNATGTFTMASGTTLQVGNGATAVTWPSGFTTANTTLNAASTVIYGCTVAQTVSGVPAYGNLTITGASVKTLGAATTVNGNLSIATGATLADGAFQLTGNSTGTFTIAGTGALQIGAATATITAFPTNFLTSNISLASTSTVTYTTITNAQTVAGSVAGVGPGTYGNLVITGASGTKTLSGNTTVAGNFTMNTSALFADGGNTLTVNGNVTNNGTHSGAGKISISGGSAAHTVTCAVTGGFSTLEINDATWTTTLNNTGTSLTTTVTNLNVVSGTLVISTFTTGNILTVTNTNVTGTLNFNGNSGTRNMGNITVNSGGSVTFTSAPGNINLVDLTINAGGSWNSTLGTTFAVSGNVTNNGTFNSGSGTYTLSGAAKTINGTIQFTGISMSGTYTNNGTMTVTTTFNGGGTLTQAANSTLNLSVAPFPTLAATAVPNLVRYFGSTNLTIKSTTYHNLQIDMNTAATTASVATTAITVNGNLNISGGILIDGGLQIVGNSTGTFTVANGATIQYGAATAGATTSNFPTNFTTANTTLGATSTTIYNTTSAVTVSAVPATYGNLTLSGTGTKTAGSAETIQGNLTHNAGTFADGGFVITVNGNITNAATINGTGRILLTGGTANHTLAGIGTYVNVELNDALGATFTGASPSISGVLTQTAGTLSLAAGTTLTLSGSLAATGTGDFGGTATSGLTITGTGALGNTLRFNASAQNLSTLTLNRTSGVVNLGSDLNLNATGNGISITTGLLYLGNFNATLNTTTTMSLGSATAMVVADAALGTGELRKIFPSGTATSFTFAIGDATGTPEYTPVNLNTFTATGGTKTIGIKVTDGVHPQMNSNGVQTNYITRFFSFSESGPATSYTYATNTYFSYINTASDVVGTLSTATAQINRYDNSTSTWYQLTSTIGTGLYNTAATYNNVSGQLGGNDFTVRFNPSQTYTWVATSGSGDWNTATNWTPSRITPASNDFLQFINGGTPTATNVPTQTIADLLISGNTDVTLTSAAATQTLTIAGTTGTTFDVASGSTLRLSSTLANSTIIAFSGTNVTNIAGTIVLNSNTSNNNTLNFTSLLAANNTITGTITNNGGVVTATTATTTFGASSFYNHNMSAGVIPAANWNATSTCTVSGATTPTTFTGVFGNLTINTTGTATLSAASTVAGNLTVSAGTFSDGSFQITGNATGTLSVASGATLQIGTAAGATTFPTLFTAGNISLATGSTVIYGSTAAQNVAGLTYHNLSLINAGAKTFLAAPTINGNFAITGCTVNDGGFQITGNATGTFTMSASASSILVLGTTTVATAFPTNFVAGNITLSSPSIVRYNSNLNQTVSNVPTYSVLQLQSAAGTPVKTLAGNTLVTGSATPMVNIGANNTFNLGGFNLTLQNSGGTSPITNTGTISANTDGGSTITLTGTGHSLAPGTILTSARPNLTISVNAAATVTIAQATPQVALSNLTIGASNTLTLSAGAQLGIAGTYTNNGTLTANTSGTTITLNGSSPQTFTVGTYTGSQIGTGNLATSGGLAINNTAGVTLGSPLNVAVLTLTNGILTTSSTNILTVVGNGAACANTGTVSSYVNGPLVRSFPASLASGTTYSFPVGKTAYNLFQLVNPTTTASATTVRLEVFDAAAGGTDGIGFSSSPTPNKYWQATVATGGFTSGGNIVLYDDVNVPPANSIVGQSATQTGTYAPLGGTVLGNTVTSTAAAATTLGFFKMGTPGCLSGTYTVGPTGNFANITAAISTLNGSQVCADVIFELQTTYNGTSGETFPITINNLTYSGGPWEVIVRPSSGVSTTLTTSGSSTTQIFSFNGADRVTFDGRPGGTGTTIRWTVANTSTSGQVFAFNNDATYDTLKYMQIEGVNTTAVGTGAYTNAGLIGFGNTAPTLGNEFNVIDNCFIREGASTPVNAIYSYGLATAGRGNDNNQITNNRIVNVFNASATTSFINLQTGNSDWTITDNNFYQTATRAYTAGAAHSVITINNTSGNNFTVSNNYIGGTAINAGGTPWTITGNFANTFIGLNLSLGSTTASTVQNNTIANMVWTCTGNSAVYPGIWTGINVTNGAVNIGNVTGNTIGAATGTGSITITSGTTGANAYGIVNTSANGAINISNNVIGALNISGTATTLSLNFTGIIFGQGLTSASQRIISTNTIGSASTANSINVGTSSSTTAQSFIGINFTAGSGGVLSITNNTIANIANGYTGTGAGLTAGILIPTCPNAGAITGNVVRNLSSTSPTIGTGSAAALIGISFTSSTNGHTIANNTVHSLSNTAATAAVNAVGIYYAPSTAGTNSINANNIHSIALSTSGAGVVYGIQVNAGSANVSNNMIRLGINAAGSAIIANHIYYGIYDNATTNNYYFNSVYIGGTGVTTGANATYAFFSVPTTGTRAIQNNIFWNARSNNTGTGKHYAIRYGAATGLTCSYNDLYVTGTGGVLGNIGGTDNSTLSSLSANSISADPVFINATGNAAAVDLHISTSASTPIEGIGINVAAITADYDNDSRASNTPEDIGADAGLFVPIDQTAPTITYTPFTGPCNTIGSGTYNVSNVTITDASGVNTTAGTKPRIYYKKSTDANDLTGWKFVEANGTTSPFNFDINFALLNSGSITAGDVIQYFVVAQDQGPNVVTPNVAINSGTFAANPSSVALTSAAFPIGVTINSFTVLPCQGTITVGTTGSDNYTSLTNPSGIFDAINGTTLSGNLTVNITSDLTAETGAIALNQWAETGVGNYTVTFQSSASVARTISGSYNGAGAATNGLVRLNGADRVTFNGGTGTQRNLIINNSGTGGNNAAFALLNGAQNNTINNCAIACGTFGATTANGVVFIGASVSSGAGGNSNNTITNNDIDNLTTFPLNGIYADGTSAVGSNTGNVISNNNITDFYIVGGGSCGGITIATANTAFNISNNNIYQTANRISASPVDYYFIRIGVNTATACSGIGFTISGNKIGGTGRDGSGNITGTWAESNSGTAHRYYGIMINQSTTTGAATTVENNIISGFNLTTSSTGNITGASAGAWNGIAVVAGNVNIGSVGNGNIIGSTTANGAITLEKNGVSGAGNSAGIWVNGASTNVNTIGNTIAGIDLTQTTSTDAQNFYAIYYLANSATTKNITNNTIGSITTTGLIRSLTGADNQILTGILSSVSTGGLINISNNRIAGLNANGGSTTSATGRTVGIEVTGGISNYNIQNNRIFNLTNQSFNNNALATPSVAGIRFAGGGTQATTISGNTIYALTHNTTTQNVSLTGIYFNGSSSTSNLISNNEIHSFEFASTSNTASLFGIVTDGTSPVTVSNNKIRLGIRPNGTSVPNSTTVTGIYDNSTAATNFYFNTVFVGGTSGSVQTGNSYAFRRNAASGADNIRNNIFANDRSGGGSGSTHYAFATNGVTGYTAANFDYNIYYSKNNTEFSINNGTANFTTAGTTALRLQALRANAPVGNNLRSGIAKLTQINFVNATGDSSAVNLQLNSNNCAVGAGIGISTISIDGFGNSRNTTGAVAIGAHEGTFNTMLADNDIYTPNFSFTTIPTQSACGTTSNTFVDVTITDIGTGVPTSGSAPVMWWRRSAPSATTWAPVTGVLQSGTGNNGVFRFTISNTYSVGETYQYYFVADDQATNQALSPAGINRWYSSYDATTPVVNLTSQTTQPTTLSSFTTNASTPLSGVKTVGTSGDYTTFNGTTSSAFFYDLAQKGISGDLTIKVISDVSELANYYPLTAPTEYCGTNFTITIRPDTNTMRTIASNASAANPLIEMTSVRRVVIDGRNNGSGQFLRFRQASTQTLMPPTFYFNGNTQNITIRNCIIEGNASQSTTSTSLGAGVINFASSLGSGTAIKNITLESNTIRNRSDLTQSAANTPISLIQIGQSNGTNSPVKSNITISNNELFNFQESAIQVRQNTSFNGIGDSIIITGNKVYMPITMATYTYPIWLEGGSNSQYNVISNNVIGGNASPTGTTLNGTWTNNRTDGEIVAIYTLNGGTSLTDGITISGNTIGNMSITGTAYTNLIGIRNESGRATITNNTITTMANSGGGDALDITANTANIGIWNQDDNEVVISGNTVTNWTTPSITQRFLYMVGIQHGSNQYLNGVDYTNNPAGKATITNNTVSNLYCGSGLQSVTLSPDALIGIFAFPANGTTGNDVSGNTISGLRATLTNAFNTRVYGIGVGLGGYGATCTGTVSKNKVYDLNNTGGGSATEINGMVAAGGNWTISNNMVSITNSVFSTTYPIITGILDWMTTGRTGAVYNNSVYIGGTVGTGGANSSYAYCRIPNGTGLVQGATIKLRNNIFFNDRTGNSTNNIAIGNLTQGNSTDAAAGWDCNYNFLLTRNTAQVGRWVGTTAGDRNITNWRTTSGGDNNSWSVAAAGSSSNTQLLASDFFTNTSTGDLSINTGNQAAWFVNGKGVAGAQVGSLATDYDGTTRNTTYGYGIDIGADEFAVAGGNVPHVLTGTPTPGGTTSFDFAGRTVASVNWGSSGTVPTSVSCQYYSGYDPGTVGTAYLASSKANFVYEITASGGSGFTYTANLNYDPALLGTYSGSEGSMRLVKTRNNWFDEHAAINTTTKVLSSNSSLNSFSWFTGGVANEPLPIALADFKASCNGDVVTINWTTATEVNNDYFTIQRSTDLVTFENIAIVDGAGNSNNFRNYAAKDENPLQGTAYYRLMQTDYDGQFEVFAPVAVSCAASGSDVVSLYPNPANNELNISMTLGGADRGNIVIYNSLGQRVVSQFVQPLKGQNSYTLDVSNLPAGQYFVNYMMEGKTFPTQKLVITR